MPTSPPPAAAVSLYLRDFSDSIALLAGARRIDLGHIRGVLTGRAMFSRFYDTVFPPLVTCETVPMVRDLALQHEARPAWLLDADHLDEAMAIELETHGFARTAMWTGMWRSSERLPEVDAPPGIRVTPVEGVAAMQRWSRICTEVENLDVAQAETFEELFLTLQQQGAAWTHLIAQAEGRDIATASLFITGRIAAIDWVNTVRELRHRGIASHLVSKLLRDARGSFDLAVLTSTEPGRGLYQRLGFRDCSRIAAYRTARER